MASIIPLVLLILNYLFQAINANQFFDKSIPDGETVLTEEDFQRIRRLKRQISIHVQLDEIIDDSAMYNESRFEGDIVNPGLNARSLKSTLEDSPLVSSMPGIQRNAVKQPYLKWRSAKIPYAISKQYTTFGKERIAEALEEYRTKTCVEFQPKTDADIDYVYIFPDDGCYSLVGKVENNRYFLYNVKPKLPEFEQVSLGDGCMSKGIIIHELMHAVGFFHEQSRADRDDYVNVLWDNIEKGLQDQFDKYSLNMIDYLGTKYDYGSVMHYGPLAFSKNGRPTIEPKQKGVTIGQRIGFSPTDLYKINRLYNCPEQSSQPSPPQGLTNVQQPSSTGGDTGTLSVEISGNGGAAKCADLRSDCAYLAGRGHCDSVFSAAFMQVNCPHSCRKCASDASSGFPCEDQREWCSRWAASGMCDLYIFQQYMHTNCLRSCALC